MQTCAAALIDRVIHHDDITMGESYRLKEKRKAGILGRAQQPTPTETEEVNRPDFSGDLLV